MRLSPVVALGLTNFGILSWFWYGAATINASAYESSAQDTPNEDKKDAISDKRVPDSQAPAESKVLILNKGSGTAIEADFSSSDSDILGQTNDIALLATSEISLKPATLQSIALRPFDSIRPEQIKQVVSRSLEPVSAPRLERFKVQEAVAQSFNSRAISSTNSAISSATPAATTPVVSPTFSATAPSQQLAPALESFQDSSRQATEVFYTHRVDTSRLAQNNEQTAGGQFAQFTPSEPVNVTPPVVPDASRSWPVLTSPPTPNIPASAASAAGFPVLSTGVDENYILGPGDIIDVSFFNVPEYSGQHRISTSGTIDLPLIGRTSVRGLTLNQAGSAIANQYRSQLQSPIVSINVVQQRPVQVAVSGEIVQPGLYTITAQGSDYPRLFQALQQAGGLTQAAALNKVEVRRIEITGQQTTIEIDLLALLQDGDINQNIFLQDGDSIVIPSSTTLDKAALSQLAESNLRANSGRPISIAIVGEVTQPGPYQLGGENGQATVVQALQTAGGVTPSANLRDVQLRRQTRQGAEQVFDINLWELIQNGDVSQDLALQQGDTLLIPTADELSVEETTSLAASSLSPGTIPINIIGEVESPGTLSVASNTSFNEALLASGGFNRRAKSEATLLRFNPNGTVDRQFIDVDLTANINSETNPLLRPNDVIVVGRSAQAAFDDSVSSLTNTLGSIFPLLFLF